MLGMARYDCESEEAYQKWLGKVVLFGIITVVLGIVGIVEAIVLIIKFW